MKSNTIAFALALLSLASGLAACATTVKPAPQRKFSGRCLHPSVNHGAPFLVAPDTKFDGSSLTVYFQDGTNITLFGAICVLQEETP